MRCSRGRTGLTLVEVAIVGGLMAFLAVLLSHTWSGLGKPTAELAARSRVTQEARLAVASLGRDLGGFLPAPEGRLGEAGLYRLVGRLQPGGTQLWLCYDGGSTPNGLPDWAAPDRVVVYEVQSGKLVRWDQANGTTFVVARYVEDFRLENLGDCVRITLSFRFRTVARTFTLVARAP